VNNAKMQWNWLRGPEFSLRALDPLQCTYHPNRSIDDTISIALHTALTHLDKRNNYVRMLFIVYSSAFNTTVVTKLRTRNKHLPLLLDDGLQALTECDRTGIVCGG
jgi:hypothetical protein